MTQELEIEKDLARWSRQRWIFSVVFIFALQAGGIYWASRGGDVTPVRAGASARVVLGSHPRAEMLAAPTVDPLLFASADIAGFSGYGWLHPRPWNYNTEGLSERREFLRFAEGARILREPLPPDPIHNVAAAPLFSPAPRNAQPVNLRAPGRSRLLVQGDLRGRNVVATPELPVQKAADVLNSTIIETGVNPDGLVVSARLVGRSGSKTADQEALSLTRALRFEPSPDPRGDLAWGKLIFQWFAVNLNSTNAAPR